jgi:hypothetical protein
MPALLVLGSKPDPIVPVAGAFDALGCANASGRTGRTLGLEDPTYTVLSSVVASGKNASNRLALAALRGLFTERLYVYPRPPYPHSLAKRLRHFGQVLRTKPLPLRLVLRRAGYRYGQIAFPPLSSLFERIRTLCGDAPEVEAAMREKAPSTGLMALAMGLADRRWDRVIASGFSFEVTHGYAANPDIEARGSAASAHADTDITILRHLAKCDDRLATTEPIVHERTGLALLPGRVS